MGINICPVWKRRCFGTLKRVSNCLRSLRHQWAQTVGAISTRSLLQFSRERRVRPTGMNKMVINHLEKLFVTSDASTIVNELEIQHPAARLIVLAAQAQEQEIGDATNFVRALFCALLLTILHYIV